MHGALGIALHGAVGCRGLAEALSQAALRPLLPASHQLGENGDWLPGGGPWAGALPCLGAGAWGRPGASLLPEAVWNRSQPSWALSTGTLPAMAAFSGPGAILVIMSRTLSGACLGFGSLARVSSEARAGLLGLPTPEG